MYLLGRSSALIPNATSTWRRTLSLDARRVKELSSASDTDLRAITLDAQMPCVVRGARRDSRRIKELMDSLRSAADRMVELELGRFDCNDFQKVTLPLSYYLEWLEQGNTHVEGKSLYLAQSNIWNVTLRQIAPIPSFLESLIANQRVDFYQASLFLGPNGSVTPMHSDPTANWFQVVASSNSQHACKTFVLLPPSAAKILPRGKQRNTVAFDVRTSLDHDGAVNVDLVGELANGLQDTLSDQLTTCVLREHDMLYLPPRWLHTVAVDARPPLLHGYVAAIGWWHLARTR